MIEGMRYKVYLLLQWLVGAPSYGFGPSSPCMHRASLGVDSGDPVRKSNTASCVYTAMIEGMRYKVYLLLQWLVGAPSYGYGQSSPCMHRV